jgi:hypothetical protein
MVGCIAASSVMGGELLVASGRDAAVDVPDPAGAQLARSESRNVMTAATSVVVPIRPIG